MSTDLEKLSEFVVVANRLPVDLETDEDGSKNWKRSPGGSSLRSNPSCDSGMAPGSAGRGSRTRRSIR